MLRFIWLATTLSALLILALITGFQPLFWLLYIFVGGSALSYGIAWIQSRGLAVTSQEISQYPQVGQPIDLKVVVEEKIGLPRFGLRLRFQSSVSQDETTINLPANGTRTWGVTGMCDRRGWNDVGSVAVVASDITQSLDVSWTRGKPQQVLVHPRTVEIPGVSVLPSITIGEIGERGPLAGTSQTAFAIREYIPGDSMNEIHWPTSAKRGRLMTKQFEGAGRNEVWLFLDMAREAHVGRANEGTEELCVTIAASLARAFLEGGHTVGLVCDGSRFDRIEPEMGMEHFWAISQTLAQVRGEGQTSFVRLLERETVGLPAGSVMVLISTWPGVDLSGIRRSLSRRAIHFLPLLVDTPSFGIRNPRRGSDFSDDDQLSTFRIQKNDDLGSALGAARDHLANF